MIPDIVPDDGRDDFSPVTKDLLAKRSGYICAYPGCKRMTVAGSEDRSSGITMTGIAAHITAASRKGPRFDSEMSHEERSSESNGIWTCQIHGKFIDDNPSKCSTEELRRWKTQHEKWVFDRVESGTELFNEGIYRLSFGNIGTFSGENTVSLGRHNIIIGPNEAGKTTFCQILAAFSGGTHWLDFEKRFSFSGNSAKRSFIAVWHQSGHKNTIVKLSPQLVNPLQKIKKPLQRVHVELNGCPSVDWPRSSFMILNLNTQLQRERFSDPKDVFVKAIRYLADVFSIHEDLVWDSLRDELFATSLFGYRFQRRGHRRVDILVPDGRTFYLPHAALSSSELQTAFLEIALKFIQSYPNDQQWILLIDSGFYLKMDKKRLLLLFNKLNQLSELKLQTFFCMNSEKEAEVIKEIQAEKWINASRVGDLTIHSFL